MKPSTKVLLSDLIWTLLPLLYFWTAFANLDRFLQPWLVVPAGVVAVLVAGGTYFGDRGRIPDSSPDSWQALVVFVAVVALAVAVVWVAFVRWPSVATSLVLATLAGTAVGRLGYRLVYGVVRPIPAARFEQ